MSIRVSIQEGACASTRCGNGKLLCSGGRSLARELEESDCQANRDATS